jgi:hypothetical protein
MTGGIKKTGVIMQSDIDEAVKKIKEELYQESIQEIKQTFSEENLKIVLKTETLDEKISAQAGEEKTEFNVKEKIEINAVALSEKELLTLSLEKLKESIPLGKELIAYEPENISCRLIEYQEEKKEATLEVQFRGYMAINAENEILDKTIWRGLNKTEIKEYLTIFKEIQDIKIKLWPPFIMKKIPQSVNKIKIKINY